MDISDKMIGTLIVGKCIARDVIFMSNLWGCNTELFKVTLKWGSISSSSITDTI
jgi:hypothetical protein